MISSITERQKELLLIIYRYIRGTGYPPTFEEMKDKLGVSSNQSILDLLNKIEEKKAIRRSESVARGITILPHGYEVLGKPPLAPFLGISHAGVPTNTIEIEGEWEPLPGDLLKLNREVSILKVSGDSMVNAGIEDGDKVIVQNQKEFKSKDIVLVDINGESTIKRFISDNKPPYIYLKPENSKYKIIPFTNDMKLVGKVISVLKSKQLKRVD